MAVKIKGTTIREQGLTQVVQQSEGYTITRKWHGFKSIEIQTLAAKFAAQGWDTQSDLQGPIYTLTATRYSPFGNGYTERWTWRKEVVSRSIWQHPTVVAYMEANGPTYRKEIEEAIDDTTSFGYDNLTLPGQQQVFRHIANDEDQYEFETLVVSRERTYRAENQGQLPSTAFLVMGANSVIYTVSDFIGQFNVPPAIVSILPAQDADPSPDYAYGFRLRDQGGEYDGRIKFSETTDWAYGPWSTLAYTVF